jgi:peptidoglycan/xylan/chitin deacetylase (PgdA/CDA1 family)
MLNFRFASLIIFIFTAVVILLMNVSMDFAWLFLPISVTYLFILVFGSAKICAGFYLKAFCRGRPDQMTVTLTFDDGPDIASTPGILDILQKHGIKAAFFVIGHKAEKQGHLLHRIRSEGHLIGIHSYSHSPFFDLYPGKKMEQDLLRTEAVINQVEGKQAKRSGVPIRCAHRETQVSGEAGKQGFFFRPPYGVTNPVVARVVKKLGYRVIGWSLRSLDTTIKDEKKLVDRVMMRLHPGAVILLHDDREITAKVLEELILKIKEKGYRFSGLKELIG